MGNRDCRTIRTWLPAFVEGELDALSVERVSNHLAGCPGCRAEEAAYRVALPALRGVPRRAAPAELDRLVLGAVAATGRRGRRPALAPTLAGAASLLLVGLVAGTIVFRTGTPIDPTAPAHPDVVTPVAPRSPVAAPGVGEQADAAAPHGVRIAAATSASQDETRPAAAHRRHRPASTRLAGIRRSVLRVACVDEKVRVGDALTSLYGEAGYDESGKIALISVRADTAAAFEPPTDDAGSEPAP